MKNIKRCGAAGISLILLFITTLCISNSVMAQVDAKPVACVVKPHGLYPASATKVQALSLIKNDKGSATTITSGEKVYFTSGKKIVLAPGFKAEKGSKFTANIKQLTSVNSAADAAAANDKLNKSVMVSPNPFRNSFTVSINAEKACKTIIAVYNSAGVKVKEQSGVYLLKGVNTVSVNASNMASGAYMLEIKLDDSKIIKKIIKSN